MITAVLVALITTLGVIAAAAINRSAILHAGRDKQPQAPTREDVLRALAAVVAEGERARAAVQIERIRAEAIVKVAELEAERQRRAA